jgi:hypothetical protein
MLLLSIRGVVGLYCFTRGVAHCMYVMLQMFQVYVYEPTGGLQLGGRIRADVWIRDDDGPPR